MKAACIGPLLVAALLLPGTAHAFPDATPWDQDCRMCHQQTEERPASNLALEGLPATARPGARYPLAIRLNDPAMKRAGFRLLAEGCEGSGGLFTGTDDKVESEGAKLRTTYDGTTLAPGTTLMEWTVVWQAPKAGGCTLTFRLHANAGNNDLSPLGDVIYVMERQVPVAGAD